MSYQMILQCTCNANFSTVMTFIIRDKQLPSTKIFTRIITKNTDFQMSMWGNPANTIHSPNAGIMLAQY